MKKNYRERMVVKSWMIDSLLQLMKTIPYDEITITQITNKAGVSRMTYYRNYLSKDEILASYNEYLTEEFASITRTIKEMNNSSYFKALFDFSSKCKDYLYTLNKTQKLYIILEAINKNVDVITKDNDEENIYYYKFFAGAIFNTLISWIISGTKESSEEMAEKLVDFIGNNTLKHKIELYQYSFKKLD